MNRKSLYIVLAGACAIVAVMIFAMKQRGFFEESAKMKISIKTNREGVLEYIEGKAGVPEAALRFAMKILPEIVDISAIVELTGDKNHPVEILQVYANGYRIPEEVLSDICEKFLDFECSLVYN